MSAGASTLQGRSIVIGTRNPAKLREIRLILAHLPVSWRPLAEFEDVPEPEEVGETFADNARAKALHYAGATGGLALADDSGLEVDALGGRPGIHSARYAGVDKNDAANNARLVGELAGVRAELVEGRIIDEARGHNGFGYDPHFLLPELGLTTAELSPAEKARLSHRGRALRALVEKLQTIK